MDMRESKLTRRGFLKGTTGAIAASAVIALPSFQPSAEAAAAPWVGNLPTKWDHETEILIVGAGGSGLCAGVEATRKGAKVIFLEKRPTIGGDTIIASGVFYAAKTKYHTAAGITKGVEPEEYWAYLESGLDDEPLKRVRDNQQWSPIYAAITKHDPTIMKNNALQSPSMIDFIASYGMEFHPMNPVKPFQISAKKGHMAILINGMMKECTDRGAKLMTETRANKLYMDTEGRIVGLRASDEKGKEINIKAKIVILATGGFLDNDDLMKRYQAYWYTVPAGYLSPGKGIPTDHTGDGIVMAKAINASLEDMDAGCKMTSGPGEGVPSIRWLLFDTEVAYLVNEKGKRMCNEVVARYSGCALAVLRTKSKAGYAIFDDKMFKGSANARYNLDDALKNKGLFKADTAAELANAVGIDAEGLEKTIAQINKDAVSGVDSEFGKTGPTFQELKPPYYITAPAYPVRYQVKAALK